MHEIGLFTAKINFLTLKQTYKYTDMLVIRVTVKLLKNYKLLASANPSGKDFCSTMMSFSAINSQSTISLQRRHSHTRYIEVYIHLKRIKHF